MTDLIVGHSRLLQKCVEKGFTDFSIVRASVAALAEALATQKPQQQHPLAPFASAVLAEFYDFLGAHDLAARCMEPYEHFARASAKSRLTASQRSRVYLALAHVRYRQRKFPEAAKLIDHAAAGYRGAKDRFGAALTLFYRARLAHRTRAPELAAAEGLKALQAFEALGKRQYRYRIGVCHCHLAWIAYWGDDAAGADMHLKLAESGLRGFDDPIHSGRVELVRGYLGRATALRPSEFERAEKWLQSAIECFGVSRGNHLPYVATALNNLALHYIRQGDIKRAGETLDEAAAVKSPDVRSSIENDYFRARLHLKSGDATSAIAVAGDAAANAEEKKIKSLAVEALITKGRAQLLKGSPMESIQRTVSHAGRLLTGSPTVDAATLVKESDDRWIRRRRRTAIGFLLLCAQTEARRDPHGSGRTNAERLLARARALLQKVDNRFLNSWADRVSGDIARLDRAFYVPWLAADLRWKVHQEELQTWLVWAAMHRSDQPEQKSRSQVAKLLGFKGPANLGEWLYRWNRRKIENTATPRMKDILEALPVGRRRRLK